MQLDASWPARSSTLSAEIHMQFCVCLDYFCFRVLTVESHLHSALSGCPKTAAHLKARGNHINKGSSKLKKAPTPLARQCQKLRGISHSCLWAAGATLAITTWARLPPTITAARASHAARQSQPGAPAALHLGCKLQPGNLLQMDDVGPIRQP